MGCFRCNWFFPTVQYDFWHDRAAFHFLTTEENVKRYVSITEKGIKTDVALTLGIFSEIGSTKYSGLEIK